MASPGLEGLVDLACRDGVDIRPTLLRVLTDLYVQKTTHTQAEERHYVELAQRLLETVDPGTRAVVVARLAGYAHVPAALRGLIGLGESGPGSAPDIRKNDERAQDNSNTGIAHRTKQNASAGPVSASSRVLPDVAIFAPQPSPGDASRDDATPDDSDAAPVDVTRVSSTLVDSTLGDIESARLALAAPEFSRPLTLQPAPHAPMMHASMTPGDQPPEPGELVTSFFAASAEERRLILLTLDALPDASIAIHGNREEINRRLETAALRRDTQTFRREVVAALQIDHEQARRFVSDPGGEAILAIAKVLQMRAAVLQRVLLFLNPQIGQSVQRVYDLTALYQEISAASCIQFVAICRRAVKPARPSYQSVLYESAFWSDGVLTARGASTDRPSHAAAPVPRIAVERSGTR